MEQVKQIGDWKCVKTLGKGSFGVVALWKNVQSGQLAAIKEFELRNMSQRGINDRVINELKDRWKKEVDMMYNLVDCPFIVSTVPLPQCFVTNTVLSPVSPLLCLEYCTGGDLRQLLKRPENVAGLPEKDVRTFLDHMGQAISYLHEKNIIHRDIKPENILLQNKPLDGSSGRMQVWFKLGDLGFAKDLSDSQSLCSTVVGTLQYLAPEIYMGKRYDKTVDYWSFGLIAFEVACGMRPFLHGESPPQWIPYVEDKEKDIISIYRIEDDKVEFSSRIPYDTHLTEVFKQCLEQWLKIMLQLDPTRRGCKISSSAQLDATTAEQNLYGLNSLSIMLRHKRLEISSPLRRLAFVIGRSTTILDVQTSLSRQLGLAVENQLLLAADGASIQSSEPASKFTDQIDLYLIPKIVGWYRIKMKLPRIVHDFLQNCETFKNPIILRKIFGSSIYFMQSELEKLDSLRKMSNALRMWITKTITLEITNVKNQIETTLCSIKNILELEHKLQEIDDRFGFQFSVKCDTSNQSSGNNGTSQYEKEVLDLETFYKECSDSKLSLSPVRTSDLEEIYHKTLEHYESWRNGESNSVMNEHLLRGICQFVAQRDPVFNSMTNNIVMQLEHVEGQEKSISKLKIVSSKIEAIMYGIMAQRCEKQKHLLETVFGEESKVLPHPNTNVETPEPALSKKVTSKIATRMSKSDVPPQNKTTVNGTISLDGAKPISKVSMADLMQESQILQFETEDTVSNAKNILKRLMEEADEMDWEFI